jgi:serine/threonine protein kinase
MAFNVKRIRSHDCPHCEEIVNLSKAKPLAETTCPHCDQSFVAPARYGSMIILRKLNEGARSAIYEGQDRVLGKNVALKVMKVAGDDPAARQEVIDEARSLMMLNHPNIVKVHAIDTHTGQPCFIMELMAGGSLKDKLDKDGRVHQMVALKTAHEITKGLKAAAKKGLLHLDIKPANIMYDGEGTAKLLDFGYALFGIDTMVARGEIPGTPYYVSPELVEQANPDIRCDMYSLGCTLYHSLVGKPPFTGESVKHIIVARLQDYSPDIREALPNIHGKTAEFISTLMQPDPADRFVNHDEMIQAAREAFMSVEMVLDRDKAD